MNISDSLTEAVTACGISETFEGLLLGGVPVGLISFTRQQNGELLYRGEPTAISDLQELMVKRMRDGAGSVFTVFLAKRPAGAPGTLRRFYDSLARAVGAQCDLWFYDSGSNLFSNH